MHTLLLLLSAYGFCFGMMYRGGFVTRFLVSLPIFKDEDGVAFFSRMLACPYCTGFHAGWLIWGVSEFSPDIPLKPFFIGMFLFAFASSAFCYALDVLVQYLEKNSPGGN